MSRVGDLVIGAEGAAEGLPYIGLTKGGGQGEDRAEDKWYGVRVVAVGTRGVG